MSDNKSRGQRILHFPLTRIIIGLAVCISTALIAQAVVSKLLSITSLSEQSKNPIVELAIALFVLAAYITLYKFYEKRKITELSVNKLGRNFISGILAGAILQSLIIYIIYLNNGFFVISVNSFIGVLPFLMMVLANSITAEIVLIGIIFRITEEKLGSYLSLIIFALIFAAIHLVNSQGTLLSAVSIAMHAGLLLGAAYIYSRNLWFPIAIHFAWDFAQAGIFGAAVSGNMISSLLTTKIEGPALISGGYFGPQGSVQAGLFCLISTIVLMIVSHKQNKITKPFWEKNKSPSGI